MSWRLRGSAWRRAANSPWGSTTHVQKCSKVSPRSSSIWAVRALASPASVSTAPSASRRSSRASLVVAPPPGGPDDPDRRVPDAVQP